MKRKIIVSIALVLSIVLVSLMISDAPIQAQGNRRHVYDTGVITLGPNQILRITVNAGSGNDELRVRFSQMKYALAACGNGVCRASTNFITFEDILISSFNEAVWMDIDQTPGASAVRGIVVTNKPAQVNAEIINTTTGEVQSLIGVLIA